MTEFDFDRIIDRSHSDSLKWDCYAGRDILPMWVADMDFQAPPMVLSAMEARLRHGVFGYAHASDRHRATVVDYLHRRHGIAIEPNWIVWLPGCVPGLSMACASAGNPGDRLVVCPPVYPPFLAVHRDSGRELDTVSLQTDAAGRYCIDWDGMERAICPRTRLWLFCNPHNPVGRVYSKEEISRVANFCLEHDLVLCSDEIHSDLILDESATPHVSALSVDGPIRERVIMLMAASKTYNVPGLACAFAIIPNDALRRRFISSAGRLLSDINPFGYVAMEAAFKHAEPWRQALIEYLAANRDRIDQFLRERVPEITMTPMEATYLAWLDVRRLKHDRPIELFEAHGIGLSDGASYGAPGFMRMNFGCPRATLDAALIRLENAVRA